MFLSSKVLLIIVFSLLSLLSQVRSEQWYEKGNPHFLNEQDFQRLVTNPQSRTKGTVILKFFTPWCRYCRYLKDIIDHLRQKQEWSITLYEINCDSENHNFCSAMGVKSYPKMIIFVDGVFKQSMDGFYPYQVVRELFLRFNNTERAVIQMQTNDILLEKHQQLQAQKKSQHQQSIIGNSNLFENKNQQENFIEAQVIHPIKKQQTVSINFEETKNVQSKQKNEKYRKQTIQHRNENDQKSKQSKLNKITNNKEENKGSTNKVKYTQRIQKLQKNKHTDKQKSQKYDKIQKKKQPQAVIEQEQNIVIVDDNRNQIKREKIKIESILIEKDREVSVETIDVSKVLTDDLQVHNYGKYFLYGVAIIIGGCYFVHIMKAESKVEQQDSQQSHNQTATITIENSNINSNKDKEYNSSYTNNKIHQQKNQQQIYMNQVDIKDQDL